MTSRGTAVVNGRGARRARRGHPWIFEDDVIALDGGARDPVRVVDQAGAFACWAAASPASRIRLRRLSREDERPGAAWLERTVDRALALREPGAPDGCGRLVHADADGLPGLTVDRYGAHVVLQPTTAWADAVAPEVARIVAARSGSASALLRADAPARRFEGLDREVVQAFGDTPDEIACDEGGARRFVDPRRGHKTGLYLDQQENHRAAPGWLSGSVLDVFCGEGGFSLPLAAAGASVHAVDQSEEGLERARRAVRAAAPRREPRFEAGNAFDVLARLAGEGARYDGAVLDPPPFARSRARGREAARAYRDLHRRVLRLLRGGGRVLTFCCSFATDAAGFEAAVRAGAEEAGVLLRVVARPGAAPDHPERLELPESRYLKGLLLEVSEAADSPGLPKDARRADPRPA